MKLFLTILAWILDLVAVIIVLVGIPVALFLDAIKYISDLLSFYARKCYSLSTNYE